MNTELSDHRYDPERPWQYAFAWSDGVLRPLLRRVDFWAIFVCAAVLRWSMQRYRFETGLDHMVDDVPQFAQLIIFLLVFYNGVCYNRFLEAYKVTNLCAVGTTSLVSCAVGMMRTAGGSHNLARFVLALFHLAVYEGRGAISWETLRVRQLLTDVEVERLRDRGGDCPSDIVLTWALEEVRLAWEGDALPPPVASQVCGQLSALMHNLHSLKSIIRMPVALAYFQLENLFVYVFVIAVALKEAHDDLDANIVRFLFSLFVTEVTFFGIRELSIMLADPFGDDAVDLKLDRYLWAATARAAKVLDGVDLPPPATPHCAQQPARVAGRTLDLRAGQRAPRASANEGCSNEGARGLLYHPSEQRRIPPRQRDAPLAPAEVEVELAGVRSTPPTMQK